MENKFVIKKGHLNIFKEGTLLRETKTLKVILVEGREIKFNKESQMEVGSKSDYDKLKFLDQTQENFDRLEAQVLRTELNKSTQHVAQYFLVNKLSKDQLSQIKDLFSQIEKICESK